MKNYSERYISCDKCRRKERQTAVTLPLDFIGHELSYRFERWFAGQLHLKCNSTFSWGEWREVKDND